MNTLPKLIQGDLVDIIAPASRCSDDCLQSIVSLIESWGLRCRVPSNIFGKDILCANTDEMRFEQIKSAVFDPESKAIICVRGGYGSGRLIPKLMQLPKPTKAKILVGMSDITALHLFFHTYWNWASVHAGVAPDRFSEASLDALKNILFQEKNPICFIAKPLNLAAENHGKIHSSVIGGNLSILQTSMGTSWQLQARHKMVLIEEINERAYRVDRMLNHLYQASDLKNADAIIFGDFLGGNEPDGNNLISKVLMRFAAECPMPVIQIQDVGHGQNNFPLPFGTEAELILDKEIKIRCEI